MNRTYQPTLFEAATLQALRHVDYPKEATLRERFDAFHLANPHIFYVLRGMALELHEQGFQKCGIALLWEQLRWRRFIETRGKEEYRLSNSFRAFYARMILKTTLSLPRGFFELRPQPSQEGQDEDEG